LRRNRTIRLLIVGITPSARPGLERRIYELLWNSSDWAFHGRGVAACRPRPGRIIWHRHWQIYACVFPIVRAGDRPNSSGFSATTRPKPTVATPNSHGVAC